VTVLRVGAAGSAVEPARVPPPALPVLGIVVDPVETNAQLARDADLDFPVLSDPDLHTIDAYGLRHPSGHDGRDIALSASVLLDANGIVRWTHVTRNFRVRPLPAEILAAIDDLPAQP
jgi:peroxiredoxin